MLLYMKIKVKSIKKKLHTYTLKKIPLPSYSLTKPPLAYETKDFCVIYLGTSDLHFMPTHFQNHSRAFLVFVFSLT